MVDSEPRQVRANNQSAPAWEERSRIYVLSLGVFAIACWTFTRGYLDGWSIPDVPSVASSIAFVGRSLLTIKYLLILCGLAIFGLELSRWSRVKPEISAVGARAFWLFGFCKGRLAASLLLVAVHLLGPATLGNFALVALLAVGVFGGYSAAIAERRSELVSWALVCAAAIIIAYQYGREVSRVYGNARKGHPPVKVTASVSELGTEDLFDGELIWSDETGKWLIRCDEEQNVAWLFKFDASGGHVHNFELPNTHRYSDFCSSST